MVPRAGFGLETDGDISTPQIPFFSVMGVPKDCNLVFCKTSKEKGGLLKVWLYIAQVAPTFLGVIVTGTYLTAQECSSKYTAK